MATSGYYEKPGELAERPPPYSPQGTEPGSELLLTLPVFVHPCSSETKMLLAQQPSRFTLEVYKDIPQRTPHHALNFKYRLRLTNGTDENTKDMNILLDPEVICIEANPVPETLYFVLTNIQLLSCLKIDICLYTIRDAASHTGMDQHLLQLVLKTVCRYKIQYSYLGTQADANSNANRRLSLASSVKWVIIAKYLARGSSGTHSNASDETGEDNSFTDFSSSSSEKGGELSEILGSFSRNTSLSTNMASSIQRPVETDSVQTSSDSFNRPSGYDPYSTTSVEASLSLQSMQDFHHPELSTSMSTPASIHQAEDNSRSMEYRRTQSNPGTQQGVRGLLATLHGSSS